MPNRRLSHLDELMASNHLDAIILNPGPTLVYLTGLHFHLMERPTVFLYKRGDQPRLILPKLELAKLETSQIPVVASTYGDDPSTWQAVINQALAKWITGNEKVGVESIRLRFLEMDYLQKALPGVRFLAADTIIGGIRLCKDDDEISKMRKAVQIAQKALEATLPWIKPGVSELELASELMVQLFRAGSSAELPFSPIVSCGPNTANPHAVPSDRKIKRGDLVLIDWGAGFEGYNSDLTRTFAVGEITPQFMKIYQAVKAANQAGRAAGKPGLAAGVVDAAARDQIEQAGFGQFFTHRTGHGLGMEAHEEPYIFGANTMKLVKGMTYTVEPGIYLQGEGGVRIEDNVVITAEGCETLSDFSRELKIL